MTRIFQSDRLARTGLKCGKFPQAFLQGPSITAMNVAVGVAALYGVGRLNAGLHVVALLAMVVGGS